MRLWLFPGLYGDVPAPFLSIWQRGHHRLVAHFLIPINHRGEIVRAVVEPVIQRVDVRMIPAVFMLVFFADFSSSKVSECHAQTLLESMSRCQLKVPERRLG